MAKLPYTYTVHRRGQTRFAFELSAKEIGLLYHALRAEALHLDSAVPSFVRERDANKAERTAIAMRKLSERFREVR